MILIKVRAVMEDESAIFFKKLLKIAKLQKRLLKTAYIEVKSWL